MCFHLVAVRRELVIDEDGGQDADDAQHDGEFQQREARIAAERTGRFESLHGEIPSLICLISF